MVRRVRASMASSLSTARREPTLSIALPQFFALEADPLTVALTVRAQLDRDHRHPTTRADRRALVLIHLASLPDRNQDA
jgi:hypothetical protein